MTLRLFFWFALAAVAASMAWSQRDAPWLRAWIGQGDAPPRPIEFDNGSVRDLAPPASAPRSAAAKLPLPPGKLRKCWRGDEVAYTDQVCPPGFREREVAAQISVVDSQAPRTPAAAPGAAAPPGSPGSRQRTLHEALDLRPDDRLRERVMERAIDAQTK